MPRQDLALIVDDDDELAGLVKKQLEKWGYAVALAPSASNAKAWLKANRPDLVLLDVMMPGGNGLDFCRWLRAQVRFMDVPVLITSGIKDDETVRDALELGANDFLRKPFAMKALQEKLERLRR